jgi:hypothetical protein
MEMKMTSFSKLLANGAIATLIGVSSIAATTTTASAYVACNRYGDCWQTTQRYHYPVHLSVRYRDGSDNYWRHYWRRHHHGYRWHDEGNRDNGYWDSDRSWHNF